MEDESVKLRSLLAFLSTGLLLLRSELLPLRLENCRSLRAYSDVERAGAASVRTIRGDVFEDLANLDEKFDLVVCDPPALIKGRKDIPQGKHAYLQLNTLAMAKLTPAGAIVSCSCSGLLEAEDFAAALAKAASRNRRSLAWVAQGGPSPDHPVRLEFPEGRYLKAWIGVS
jgi:23S rRNA (cytosine1962-C5)-methyltransferase